MGSKVTVSVQLDRQGRSAVVEEVMPVWVVEKAFRPIDLPDGTADGFSRFLCSDVVMVEETMKARNEIAQHLTKALLDAMGAMDTSMGYPPSNAELTGAALAQRPGRAPG